jgi:hypothetical protein
VALVAGRNTGLKRIKYLSILGIHYIEGWFVMGLFINIFVTVSDFIIDI